MPYAAQSDIELAAGGFERFRDLADFDGDGIVDAAVVARAQAAADAFINPYLQNRYMLPLAAPCESLIRLAAEEAVYQIKKWRGMAALLPTDHTDREERERELKDYQTGIRRPDTAVAAPSTSRSAWVESDVDSSPISREGTKGMW